MLEFGTKVKSELQEDSMVQNAYSDIKSAKETSESSKEFWNDIFNNSDYKETESVNIDDLEVAGKLFMQ